MCSAVGLRLADLFPALPDQRARRYRGARIAAAAPSQRSQPAELAESATRETPERCAHCGQAADAFGDDPLTTVRLLGGELRLHYGCCGALGMRLLAPARDRTPDEESNDARRIARIDPALWWWIARLQYESGRYDLEWPL
jgi:hypothetical protein